MLDFREILKNKNPWIGNVETISSQESIKRISRTPMNNVNIAYVSLEIRQR